MTIDFTGRNVVVTGATGELGHAVAAMLLGAGATCHAPVRSGASRTTLESLGERLLVSPDVELADERSVSDFYSRIPRPWASIHCAGAFGMGPFVETSLESFSRLIAANTVSSFLCSREAVRRMTEAADSPEGRGRIVNVAARPALEPRGGAGKVAYTASKAAVAAMTLSVAEEVAGQGIWVNAIAPSTLDTPANRKAMPGADPSAWARVEEVAATLLFLASPANLVGRGGIVPVYGRS